MANKKNRWIKFLVIGIFIFFIYIDQSPIAKGNRLRRHSSPPIRNCFSDIRSMTDAIDMYNMDNPVMITELNDRTLQIVKDLKYLKANTPDTTSTYRKKCKYHTKGDLTENGFIYCEYHGQSDPLGKIKPSEEYYKDIRIRGIKIYLSDNSFTIVLIVTIIIIMFAV